MRFILYLVVLLELVYPEIIQSFNGDLLISRFNLILIAVIFVSNSLQIVLNIAIGFIFQAKDSVLFSRES